MISWHDANRCERRMGGGMFTGDDRRVHPPPKFRRQPCGADSSVRATVLSITNQADAVGQWTGGPAIGLIGNVFSIRAALVAGGLCMAPALALYGRAIRHSGAEPELEDKT